MTVNIRNAAAAVAADRDVYATWADAMNDIADRVEAVPATSKAAAYTLALADAGTVVEVTAATVTVPADAAVAFPVGAIVEVYQATPATVTVAAASGVTLKSPVEQTGPRSLAGAYATAVLRKRAANEWVLSGELA